MWVAPGKMLYEVYGNAFSYAFQGARLTVTEELDVGSGKGINLQNDSLHMARCSSGICHPVHT